MEHVENDAQAFRECARVLKKGGEILFFVPGRMNGLSTQEEFEGLGHYRMYNAQRFNALLDLVPSMKMTTILYPHKVHNLVWNRMKNVCRWVNYPIKKWILRDNKTYELRPFYKKILLPVISSVLNAFDLLAFKKEKNLLGAEFNVLVRFEKR